MDTINLILYFIIFITKNYGSRSIFFCYRTRSNTDFEVIYNDSMVTPIDLTGYSARMSIRQSQNR